MPMPSQTVPKVSVITVNFNMAEEIGRTLDSVLSQDYPNFESIVIDGGSTDGSRDIIASYGDRLGYWVSERDRNLYDGMNKGVRAASGDWVLFMNSGDMFASPTALSCMFAQNHAAADVVYGHHVRRYPDQGIDRVIAAERPSVLPKRMHCSHQSLLMRREILLARPFATDLLAADYESILAAYISGKKFTRVDCTVSVTPLGGRSDHNRLRVLRERILILRRHRLMNMKLAIHYTGLIIWFGIAQTAKKILPKAAVAYVLRRRPLKGLG